MQDFEKWMNEKHPEYNEPEAPEQNKQDEPKTEAVQVGGKEVWFIREANSAPPSLWKGR